MDNNLNSKMLPIPVHIKLESLEDSQSYLKKQLKITKGQKEVLMEFLEQNFEYCRGAFKLSKSAVSEDKNKLWEDITNRLNAIGPVKTSMMWRKSCADFRMQIKKKVLEERDLNDSEKRLAKFYGLSSTVDPSEKYSRLMHERVTALQKTRMVELVQDNFWFNRTTMKLEQRDPHALDWDDIGRILNELGQSQKNTVAWRKCWSDIKCDVQKKFLNGRTPKVVTEDEFKIAQIYGWFDTETSTTSHQDYCMVETDDTIKSNKSNTDETEYVIERFDDELEPSTKISTISESNLMSDNENMIAIEEEEEEPSVFNEPDVEPEEVEESITYVTQTATQTESVENKDTQNSLLEQILQAQLRTNALLEQLLEESKQGNSVQSKVLNELRTNSFMMVNRSFSQ